MADNNIDLTASFDTSNAIKGVNEFGKAATKAVDGVNESVNGLQNSITKTSSTKLDVNTSSAISSLESLKGKILAVGAGIATYFSVQAIGSFFNTMIDEAVDAQNNLNQLNAALQRTGQLTPEVSASMAKFASDLTAVSTIDDDVINGQLAIALNFTKSADKAQDLVGAAANLSAAMKIDLGTAVELLGKTLDGTAGRLNETVPALRGVSAEALKSGAAIEIVNQAFAGAATAEINTYSGAMTQLSNVFGNFAASLGNMIVQNPMVAQTIKEISAAFIGATAAIEGGTSSSIGFVNRGLIALISGIRDLLPSLNAVSSFMKSIAFLFDAMLKGVMSFVDGLKILGNTWLWLIGTMEGKQSALEDIGLAIDRMKKRGDDLAKSLDNIGKDAFSKMDLKSFDDALKRIQDAANKKPVDIPVNIKTKDIPKIELKTDEIKPVVAKTDAEVRIAEEAKRDAKESFMDFFKNAGDAAYSWISGLEENWNSLFEGGKLETLDISKFRDLLGKAARGIILGLGELAWYFKSNAPKIVEGVFSSISSSVAAVAQGAEGAKKAVPDILAKMAQGLGTAVGSIWGPVGSAIGSGIGGIFGEQIKLAAMDRAELKKQMDAFFLEIPNVLANITDNMPMIAEKLGENLPQFFLKIFETFPVIIEAFAKSAEGIGKSIGENPGKWAMVIPQIFISLVRAAVLSIKYFIQGFAQGAQKWFSEKGAEATKVMSEKLGEISKVWSEKINAIKEKLKFWTYENFFKGFGQLLSLIWGAWAKLLGDLSKIGTFFSDMFKQIGPKINEDVLKGFADLNENVNDFFNQFGISMESITGGFNYYKENIGKKIQALGGDIEKSISTGWNGLVEAGSKFFNSISNGIYNAGKKIIEGIIPESSGPISELGLQMKNSVMNFGKNLSDAFTQGIKDMFSAEFYKSVGQAIIDGFTKLFDKLNPFKAESSGGGGNKALAAATGGVSMLFPGVKAATGGVVPSGYPDDKYPAMLSSNEVVIPAATTPNLFSLIDRLANGSTTNNQSNDETNQLLRQLIAIIANQQTQVDVKIDRDTLARAILSLNKDNRRLA